MAVHVPADVALLDEIGAQRPGRRALHLRAVPPDLRRQERHAGAAVELLFPLRVPGGARGGDSPQDLGCVALGAGLRQEVRPPAFGRADGEAGLDAGGEPDGHGVRRAVQHRRDERHPLESVEERGAGRGCREVEALEHRLAAPERARRRDGRVSRADA